MDGAQPHGCAHRFFCELATFQQQRKNNASVTEFVEVPGRGHSITIDSGWRPVAQLCLDFVARFV